MTHDGSQQANDDPQRPAHANADVNEYRGWPKRRDTSFGPRYVFFLTYSFIIDMLVQNRPTKANEDVYIDYIVN